MSLTLSFHLPLKDSPQTKSAQLYNHNPKRTADPKTWVGGSFLLDKIFI